MVFGLLPTRPRALLCHRACGEAPLAYTSTAGRRGSAPRGRRDSARGCRSSSSWCSLRRNRGRQTESGSAPSTRVRSRRGAVGPAPGAVGDAVGERAAVGVVARLERADDADELDLEVVGAGADDGIAVAADVGEGEVRRDLGVARLEGALAVVGALQLEAGADAVEDRPVERRLEGRRGRRLVEVERPQSARVPRGKASNRRNLLEQRCGNDPARRNRLAERRNGRSRDEIARAGGEISLRTAAAPQMRDLNPRLRDRAILRRGPEATIGDQTS